MYGVTNLEEFNKFEESVNRFHANDENINIEVKTEETEDFEIKLHDLHHSIDIKVEDRSFEKRQPNNYPEVTMSEKRKIQFTKDEEQMLVDLVKANECLWNITCSDFKNVKKRTELWQQIATQINKPVDDLKKKWKNLRDYKKEKERKKIKGIKKPTGFEPTADGEENVFSNTDDEVTASKLSFLDSYPTERKRKNSGFAPTVADVPSSSISAVCSTTEFQRDDINSTMDEIELPKAKRTRRESIRPSVEVGRNRVNQFQLKFKEDNVHPIRKLFDCFADSVIELPRDLQRLAKTKIMNLITELDEIASYRTNKSLNTISENV